MSRAIERLVIVPRWGGGPDSDFYPWLADQLASQVEVRRLIMLRPDAPRIREWVPAILAQLWVDPEATLLLGHSVGCQAILRALADLRPGTRVGGLVCVAGWWTVDAPWQTLLPWMELDHDLARARAAVPEGRCNMLSSDDDPFTSGQVENRRLWVERMGARITAVPDRKHFNAPEEPAVLSALLESI